MSKHWAAVMLVMLAGCGTEPEPEATAVAASEAAQGEAIVETTSAPVASASSAVPDEAASPGGALAGARAKVTQEAKCYETADPSASPWTMYPGVEVEYRGTKDGKARVVGISGEECLIDAAAIAPL